MGTGKAGTKGLLPLLLGILSVYAAGEASSAYALDQSYSNKLMH